jgi:class 3 adenylate cyclase/tetratricopeptide (TPR) repeat protein
MICFHCRTLNPESHHFCRRCGRLLGEHCPRCGSTPAAGDDFCGNCGLALTPAAQFAWGDSPAPTSAPTVAPPRPSDPARSSEAPSPQSALDQYIPRELRTKLEAARARGGPAGERRVVTMLFCDVKGSTEAAGRLDPEDWTEIINGAFEYMIRPVYRYEGTVARLMGDGILAFFGAPIAHEDDPQRAVLTGLDIVDGLAPYRDRIRARWEIEINVRVGINTGLVVVGTVGSDLRMEYTAMGDAINLAARMEQTAEPGTVRIAHDTYKQVAAQFEFEDLGGIEVKGKAEPVQAYRVLGRKTAGRARGIEGLEAGLVGRADELARLESALANLERGVGRIVCVLGDAGLGKSRLIRELKEKLPPDSGAAWYEVASLSYESGDPYAMFQQLVRRLTGISAGEEPEAFWEKIKALVSLLPEDGAGRAVRVFAALFGRPDPEGRSALEGELFQRELYAVMTGVWEARFAGRPAVIVMDDLHWADPASIDLLLHLLPAVEKGPVVLLCAFRPDRAAPAYRVRQTADNDYPHRYTEVNLRPLSPEEGDELVNRLLTIAELPDGLRERIRERAAGNPFYVEEVVRTLIDKGAVYPEDRPENGEVRRYWRAATESAEIEIPDNLQGLLASRIDRLEEGTRHVVQLASVIGRSFYQRVLVEIGRPDDLSLADIDDQVGRLVRLEMVQEAARVPDVEYRFRNPMTQEIAYRTILLKRRQEFHQRVGQALEALFPDRHTELAPRLAHHFLAAREGPRALAYLTLSADNAFRLFALEEARSGYTQALEWADQGDATDEQLVHLHLRKGRTLELLLRHDEAFEIYRAMEAIGEERDSDALRLAGISAQGIAYVVGRFDLENARIYGDKALALARRIGDRYTEGRAQWGLLLASTWADVDHALESGTQGLEIARELAAQTDASHDVKELLALILMDLTTPLIGRGQMPTAMAYAAEAKTLFEALGNLPMVSTAMQRLGQAYRAEGRLVPAAEIYEEATRMDQSIGNEGGLVGSTLGLLDVYHQLGEIDLFFERRDLLMPVLAREKRMPVELAELYPMVVYTLMGDPARAVALSHAHSDFLRSDARIWPDLYRSFQALAQVSLGELKAARETLSQIHPGVEQVNYIVPLAALVPGAWAELALAEGDWKGALEIVDAFLERVRGHGVIVMIPEKLLLRGRILLRAGRPEEAVAAFKEAHALAGEQQARMLLWRTGAQLAELEAENGNQEQARVYAEQARAAVDFILEHTSRADLRASFLAMPQVRTVMEQTGGSEETAIE